MEQSSYLAVVKSSPRPLIYAVSHSFFSGLGQTYLISLFIPHIQQMTHKEHSYLGYMYAFATILAAFTVPFLGAFIDKMHLKRFSLITGLIVSLGWSLMAFSANVLFFFLGTFLLRLGGQSLMGHIAATGTARYFNHDRGKALAISNLGYPFNEALFPFITVSLLSLFPWHIVCVIMASSIFFIFLPLVHFIISSKDPFVCPENLFILKMKSFSTLKTQTLEALNKETNHHSLEKHWNRKDVLKDPYFYMLLPFNAISPFMCTGLFFYQNEIASIKLWNIETLALGFSAFAASRIIASFVCGIFVDFFGAPRLVSLGLIPFLLGLLLLTFGTGGHVAWVYMGFLGLTVGWQSTMTPALWSEVYGTINLGAIRSTISPILVASTALATPLFGYYFDHFKHLDLLMFIAIVLVLFSTAMAYGASVYYRKKREKIAGYPEQQKIRELQESCSDKALDKAS